jgi:signal transduction histidine kinase
LSARATVTGPLEVRRVANGLNRLAARIDDLPPGIPCDAAVVVTERAAFWRPLAEDQDRHMSVEVPAEPVIVQASREDLAACADVLLENVFTHTPEGVSFAIRLSRRASGGAWLVVADDGPGFPPGSPVRRGQSGGGSTGLGLDIARRVAEASGETMTVGRSAAGGGCVSLGLGPPAGLLARRRHRRAGLRAIEPGTRR